MGVSVCVGWKLQSSSNSRTLNAEIDNSKRTHHLTTQEKVEPDPGDGPVRKRQETAHKRAPEREPSGIRIWPLPAGSYTFTQPFGCVPQLGNLYAPGAGCPPTGR